MMHPNIQSPQPVPPVVRVSGCTGLLATVPALLGFHPAESAVLVCLAGARRRVGPVVRVDLGPYIGGQDPVARVLAAFVPAAARYADEVALVIYTDRPGQVDAAAIEVGLGRVCPVLDVIVTGNSAQPISGDLMAAIATTGRTVLTDRAALARSVEYRPGMDLVHLLAEFDTLTGRDALILRRLPDRDAVAALITAAQAVKDTDPRTPDVCAALAVLAYRHGDGALALVALERATRTAPGHRLAALMDTLIAAQVTPAALDTAITG